MSKKYHYFLVLGNAAVYAQLITQADVYVDNEVIIANDKKIKIQY